ncbi:BamA/TamA family outer membrane protein [Dysgonomonas sp. Marseille-P4677]|uniref:BamA/TamA family outer membrane protein n=1 Tax=Dysgonomonas sp. Marseille-P4677 TaxID=2364790 RepID=UPI001912E122|nr:BamA/TamA family outer membrane protein [Dysgonomonas sp. Marseille-P4677]MBK5721678.1 BamA/TamA family outer membrane protein [Dysgonomonas sp. Marseille-P4677]
MRKVLVILIIVCSHGTLIAQGSFVSDSTKIAKKNVFSRLIEYFEKSNEVNNDKRFDFSIIGGPHYSSDTKLGLGLVASGLYRLDREDLSMSPSNVSLYGDITTTGAYVIGISGNTLFPKLKYRIDADMYFSYKPSRYWGIGYDAGRKDYYSEFDNLTTEIKFDFLKKITKDTYLGIITNFRNVKGKDFDDISLLNGESDKSTAIGGGLIFSYDSRDFIPNPYSGFYLKLEQIFYPKFLGSTYNFNKSEFIFRYYRQLWKGAVVAYDLQGIFNNGDASWNMLALTGDSHQMRGYYIGQYRDKKMIQTQVELRQKIYRRSGAVVWAGAGNVFPKFSAFDWKHTLPTFGIGYRWEFKNRVNVRLDYGIGKGQSAFYFNINEAF